MGDEGSGKRSMQKDGGSDAPSGIVGQLYFWHDVDCQFAGQRYFQGIRRIRHLADEKQNLDLAALLVD